MMLDILDSQTTVPHEEPKRSKLPKRRGKTEMERKDKFYLHIGSLGVHASRTRTPYLKVISAEGTVSSTCEYEEVSTSVDNATAGFGEFTDALQVKVTAGHAQLRIQLFQDRAESELLGQAIVYEANAEHGPCWRHIYGPRRAGGLSMLGLGVLDSQTEEAEEMARGRLPPSCYHGSLYITCDRFAGRIVGLVSQMTRSLLPSRFRVRLHRGVYLDRYCNQKLLVRVEIPGSAPLLFPGEVNAQGALRFGRVRWRRTTPGWRDGAMDFYWRKSARRLCTSTVNTMDCPGPRRSLAQFSCTSRTHRPCHSGLCCSTTGPCWRRRSCLAPRHRAFSLAAPPWTRRQAPCPRRRSR